MRYGKAYLVEKDNTQITMLTQALNRPNKFSKRRIVFVDSLCTSTTCTFIRESISGFGKKPKAHE